MAADFASLVSLACHDLRTPLATVQGFAKTLLRLETLEDEKASRYLSLIDAASDELVQLLDLVSIAARIESGRYEPNLQQSDSLALARAALPDATGEGAVVHVDTAAAVTALGALARAARRHGNVDVSTTVAGPVVRIEPVTAAAAPIVLGEEQRDLGAAVAVRLVRALGGEVVIEGGRLLVRLPSDPVSAAAATAAGP